MKLQLTFPIIAMALVVVASNILVQFLVEGSSFEWVIDWTGLAGFLTLGAFTYPFAFLVTDLTNRIYGAKEARRVVFYGLVIGVSLSLVGTQIDGQFGPLVTWRVLVGSAAAFFIAHMVDISIFRYIYERSYAKEWKRAPFISSMVGSALDTMIFFSVAFSALTLGMLPASDGGEWALEMVPLIGFGPLAPLWVSLAMADWAVKFTIALVALIPFRLIALSVRAI